MIMIMIMNMIMIMIMFMTAVLHRKIAKTMRAKKRHDYNRSAASGKVAIDNSIICNLWTLKMTKCNKSVQIFSEKLLKHCAQKSATSLFMTAVTRALYAFHLYVRHGEMLGDFLILTYTLR